MKAKTILIATLFVASSLYLVAQSGTTERNGRQLTCASDDGNRHYCSANTLFGVRMLQQRSGSPCIQNQTWGYDRKGIWVDRGCRADFQTGSLFSPIRGSGNTITCSSDNGGRQYCPADTRGGVQLQQQRSGSPCIQGQTWGYDGRGIWVDRGCRADFFVGNSFDSGQEGNTITCSSDNGGRQYCPADTRGGVQLQRQRSGSPCIQGQTWGYDRNGIWVDRGCRADFALGTRR